MNKKIEYTKKGLAIEKAIKQNFPGKNNKALRSELRSCNNAEQIRGLANTIAFSLSGKLGLEAIAKLF